MYNIQIVLRFFRLDFLMHRYFSTHSPHDWLHGWTSVQWICTVIFQPSSLHLQFTIFKSFVCFLFFRVCFVRFVRFNEIIWYGIVHMQKLRIKTANRPPLKCMHRAHTMTLLLAKRSQVYRRKVTHIRMKEVNQIIWWVYSSNSLCNSFSSCSFIRCDLPILSNRDQRTEISSETNHMGN